MKKKLWILTAVLVIAAIAIGATFAMADTGGSPAPTPTPTATPAHTTVNVNASYSGSLVNLSVGDLLIVTLDSNPSTGFAWTNASISNASVIKETSREFKSGTTTVIGAGGQDVWTFKAQAKGTSTISMNYSRSWEKDVAPIATFNMTIVVK